MTDHSPEILPVSSYFAVSTYGRAASGSRDGVDGRHRMPGENKIKIRIKR
jgi:hypothetical protein